MQAIQSVLPSIIKRLRPYYLEKNVKTCFRTLIENVMCC